MCADALTQARPQQQRSRRRGRGGASKAAAAAAVGQAPRPQGGEQPPKALKVSPEQILAAVESLYVDQVKPHGRILIKRLAEMCSEKAGELPRIDTEHLRSVCQESEHFQVELSDGSEYCALLVGREGNFVDANSNEDPYSSEFWAAVATYFSAPERQDLKLPSGRYACGQELMAAKIPLFSGCSLGQVCHVVQLAISQRFILGFREDNLVPYERSAAVLKKRCAEMQQPALELKKGALPIADLTQARECLREMLANPRTGKSGCLPLSNVKRLFRSRFQLELSETALGHSRICDLLQDQRFQDICYLTVQGSTYTVVQATETARDENVTLNDSSVARTFIHFEPAPPVTPRRSSSVPKDHGSGVSSTRNDTTRDHSDCETLSPCSSNGESPVTSPAGASGTPVKERASGGSRKRTSKTSAPATEKVNAVPPHHRSEPNFASAKDTAECAASKVRETITLFDSLGLGSEKKADPAEPTLIPISADRLVTFDEFDCTPSKAGIAGLLPDFSMPGAPEKLVADPTEPTLIPISADRLVTFDEYDLSPAKAETIKATGLPIPSDRFGDISSTPTKADTPATVETPSEFPVPNDRLVTFDEFENGGDEWSFLFSPTTIGTASPPGLEQSSPSFCSPVGRA